MRKLNSSGRGSGAAAQARRNEKRRSKRRRRDQYRFGLLNHAVREDRDERGEPRDLSAEDVLAWADAFRERTGDWPTCDSGPIPEAPGETWLLVEAALALGLRGFPPGGSIPRFLDEHRGRYNCMGQKFTMEQVLAWADAWYARTGDWPYILSGVIPGSGGVTWRGVDRAFRCGRGMVRGGSSLAHVLASRRGVVRHPPFTEEQILAWADAHHRRTGKWPCKSSGPIAEAPEETWLAVDSALYRREARSRRWFVARATARRAAASETFEPCSAAYDCSSPRLGRSTPRTNGAMAQCRFRPCSGGDRRALEFTDQCHLSRTSRPPGRFDAHPATDRTPRNPKQSLCAAAHDPPDPCLGQCLSRPQRPMASSGLRTGHRGTRRELVCDR